MLAGENFGKFGNLLRIHQSFIRQLLVASEKARGYRLKFANVFFTKCNSACHSPRYSTLNAPQYDSYTSVVVAECGIYLHKIFDWRSMCDPKSISQVFTL